MIRALLILLLYALALCAQVSGPTAVLIGDPPGGVGAACTAPALFYANLTTGVLAACISSVWTAYTSGSGMVYPGAGVANSTGVGWGTSYSPSITVSGQTCTLGSSCTIPLSSMNPRTATYQVTNTDFTNYKTITVASGTFTVTLVDAGSQPSSGRYINIVNYGSGVLTIATSGQNLNGSASSMTLPASSASAPNSITIWSDGTDYFARTSGAVSSVFGMTGAIANLSGVITTSGSSVTSFNSSTGGGAVVLANTPTLITPVIGVATGTSLTLGGNVVSTAVNNLSFFAATTSAQLLGVLSDETGSGLAVFGTSPTIVTPVIASIVPGADFTLSQNSVAPFTSVNSGAVASTVYLSAGKVGILNSAPQSALDIHNGTSTNIVRVYNTFTDASNGSWFQIEANTNGNMYVGSSKNGSGSAADVYFLRGGSSVFALSSAAFYPAGGASAADLGLSGTPVRNVYANGLVSKGTTFTASGCSNGTLVGGATAGTFASGTTGACTVTITMGSGTTAASTGWACAASDRTTPANLISQSASTTSTATITGTTVSGDVISFSCIGY